MTETTPTTPHGRARGALTGAMGRLVMAQLGDNAQLIINAMVEFASSENEHLREALAKIYRRSAAHEEDTAEDRVRNLYHVHADAANALGLEKKPFHVLVKPDTENERDVG